MNIKDMTIQQRAAVTYAELQRRREKREKEALIHIYDNVARVKNYQAKKYNRW